MNVEYITTYVELGCILLTVLGLSLALASAIISDNRVALYSVGAVAVISIVFWVFVLNTKITIYPSDEYNIEHLAEDYNAQLQYGNPETMKDLPSVHEVDFFGSKHWYYYVEAPLPTPTPIPRPEYLLNNDPIKEN